jgi:hypothetical protein
MLTIELRRAITPEESGEHECALCGASFRVGGVYAWPVTDDHREIHDGGAACPSCVAYFRERNPERFPSLEEYEEAAASYPEPILASVEEALRLEDAGKMGAVYAASEPFRR